MRDAPPPNPVILVTNDDGINAPGIKVLERIARSLSDRVHVVAPEINHSGAGHSLTLRRPLRVRRIDEHHHAVDGTPTDCVMVGLHNLFRDRKIDLVLSGVNHGGNMGEDVTYSGTIAAAMEATLMRVPAIALSQACKDREPVRWGVAEKHAPDVIKRCLAIPWDEDVLLNLNFPDVAVDAVRGVKVTRQGKRKIGDELIERVDPRGEPYIWVGLPRDGDAVEPGTDLAAVRDGYVSVTPLHMDMTHDAGIEVLRKRLQDK